jgi:hypothetical protein
VHDPFSQSTNQHSPCHPSWSHSHPLTRKHPTPHFLVSDGGRLFPSALFLTKPSIAASSYPHFFYFVCDAEHLRLSLIRPSLPIEFTWPSAPLITPPPTSPAVFVGPPFVTPHQPHARVHNCSTPNLQLSRFTPSLPADLVTCLTSSRLRFCWLWWRPEYLPKMPFSAAMANCVLQIYRVAPVRPCHPINAEKSR